MPGLHRDRVPQGQRTVILQLLDIPELLLPSDHDQGVHWEEPSGPQRRCKLEERPQELHPDAQPALRVRCAELAHHRGRIGKFPWLFRRFMG